MDQGLQSLKDVQSFNITILNLCEETFQPTFFESQET